MLVFNLVLAWAASLGPIGGAARVRIAAPLRYDLSAVDCRR